MEILNKTELFEPIKLEEMDRVKLMNRTDTKYWFHASQLNSILSAVRNQYYQLEIGGRVEMPYSTVYFDTPNDSMFTTHHNGKLNRYKVRRRTYVSSCISFLEVKFKNNKGRTIKKRISSEYTGEDFLGFEQEFLRQHVPFQVEQLQPALINKFSRITLVNKNFKERCTIDFGLAFRINGKQLLLENLVIVEVKSEGASSLSPMKVVLRDYRIKKSGFSKYCVGRTLTDTGLKRNAFKPKIRQIEKTIKSENNLYTLN